MMGISVERPEIQAEVQGQPVVIPPTTAESIRARTYSWEFRGSRQDGSIAWLGLDTAGVNSCVASLEIYSRDYRRAIENPTK